MLRSISVRRPILAFLALGTLVVLTFGAAATAQAHPPATALKPAAVATPSSPATSSVSPGDRPDSGEGSGFPWVKVVLGVAVAGLVTVAIVGARTRRRLDQPDDGR